MSQETLQKKTQKLAWLFFGIVSLSYIMVYFHRVAPAVVSDLLMSEFNLSGAVLGNLAAIYFYVYTLMQLPAGILSDSFGAKKTIFWGMLVSGVGSFIFAGSNILILAYVGRILIGFGVSVIFVSMLKIVTEWFSERQFGALSGISLFIGNLGAVFAATPFAYVVSIWGWRTSFAIIGGFSIFTGILALVLVKDRPAAIGLPSPNGVTVGTGVQMGLGDVIQGLGKVMKNPLSWPPFVVLFGLYGSLMAFQGIWGLPFLVQQYGMARFEAAFNLLIIAMGLVIGCPLAGFISDRIEKRKLPLMVSVFLYSICWIIMLAWPGGKPSVEILPVLFFFMGFFASGFVIIWSCTKEVNPLALSGCSIGLANMGGSLGAAVVQPLFGWALDKKWQGAMEEGVRIYPLEAWRFAFTLVVFILVSTALFGIFITEPGSKQVSEIENKGGHFSGGEAAPRDSQD